MSATSSTATSSNWTISPVTLAEYANAIYEVLGIISDPRFALSNSQINNEEIFSIAQRLTFLNKQLQDHQQWGLLGSSQEKAHCQAIQDRLNPLERLYVEGTASPLQILNMIIGLSNTADFRSEIASALSGLSPLQEGELNISPEEVMFIETFRKFNNESDSLLSDVGDVLSAASEMLEGLNLLNEACTWNPGQKYISSKGTLVNASSSDAWYPIFISQADTSKIKGLRLLRDVLASGFYPVTSNEFTYLQKILLKVDAPHGFGGLINETLVKKMWEDQSFQVDLRTAIELSLNINEQAQHEINKVLLQTKTIADATANLFESQNQSLTNIARRINR